MMQNITFWTVIFTTEPKMLAHTILTRLAKVKIRTSLISAMAPAGSEYIIAEMLPENKLPSSAFTIKTEKAETFPRVINANSINIFERPIFAPGRINGGKRFSSKNVMVASEASNPVKAILEVIFLDITLSPRYRT